MQSRIKSQLGRKQLLALRAEARSANHFKQVSYKLENKVVELTQTITAMTGEKDQMNERVTALEAEIKAWRVKYEKLEQASKESESQLNEATVSQTEWDTLKQKHDVLHENYTSSLNDLKARERDIAEIQEQLEKEKQEKEKLHQQLMETKDKTDHDTDESDVAELRNQVAALKQQLAQAMRAPRRQGSSRGLSPAIGRNVSTSPVKGAGLEPTGYTNRPRSRSPGLLNRKARRSSMAGTSVSEPVQPITKNPRPTSIDQYSSLLSTRSSNMNENPQEEV